MDTETTLRQRLKLSRHDRQTLTQLVSVLSTRGDLRQAAKYLTQLCELSPETPQLWLELAKVWLHAGSPKDAAIAARTGLARDADAYESQCLLAEAHERAGNIALAIAACRAGVTARPASAALHNNLGRLLRLRGDFLAAHEEFDLAIAAAPDSASNFNNRANVLRDMGRFEDALTAYERALELDPDSAESHFNRGLVLLQMNRGEQAAGEFSQTLGWWPDHAEAALQLIEALIAIGRFDQAEAEVTQVLSRHPGLARAWYLKAMISPPQSDANQLIESIRALRCNQRLPPEDASHLDYALGKLLDEQGAYDDAFSHYRMANRVQHDSYPSERRRHHAKLIEAATCLPLAHWADPVAPKSTDGVRPIFIVGMPRSGTTLVEQILSAHPSVHAGGEVDFFGPALIWIAPSAHRDMTVETKLGGLIALTVAQKKGIRNGYLRRLQALGADDSLWVTDKTPLNFLYLGLLQQLFPSARFVHCRRHPLDTCLSIYFQQFGGLEFACDLNEIGAVYREYSALMQHWRALPSLDLFDMRYESLVEDPESSVRALLNALDLPWHDACLAPHTQSRTINTASRWQARQPIYRHAAARWPHYQKHLTSLKATLGVCLEDEE